MKYIKLAAVLLAALMLFSCSAQKIGGIAYIADPAGETDRFENQAIISALQSYCEINGKTCTVYTAPSRDSAGFGDALEKAAASGADVIICGSESASYGEKFAASHLSQAFMLVNYTSSSLTENVRAVDFAGEQAAFLAGAAAVADGHTSLGFIGGIDNVINRRYLNGFISGVNYMAGIRGLKASVAVCFTGCDQPEEGIKKLSESMFSSGVTLAFVSGGNIYKSCVTAANTYKARLIGGEMDQAGESERFITTACKGYQTVFTSELNGYYENGSWKTVAGISVLRGVADGSCYLPSYTGAFRFTSYTQAEYESLKLMFIRGGITVSRDTAVMPEQPNVTVSYTEYVKVETSEASS